MESTLLNKRHCFQGLRIISLGIAFSIREKVTTIALLLTSQCCITKKKNFSASVLKNPTQTSLSHTLKTMKRLIVVNTIWPGLDI